jgi:hypothetical protein
LRHQSSILHLLQRKRLSIHNNSDTENQRQSRQIVIDRAAAQIVYQTVDSRSGVVINQFPDEARLRTRAYLRAQDEVKRDHANKNTDVKA